jgi:hypothetical protein
LWWVSVTVKAEADMSLIAQRLRPVAGVRAPALDTRLLQVKAGESFTINARKTEGFWVGERVPLDRVANKRPINRKWRTVATL